MTQSRVRRWSKRVLLWGGGIVALAVVAFFVAYARSSNSCDDPKSAPAHPMKAIVHCDYGSPDVLAVADVEKPTPDDDQLLVKVRAASVNPLDWHFIEGLPYLLRASAGLRRPKDIRVGVDFAGTVEAVGKNVKQFAPGDEVFGGRRGALSQYLCVREDGAVVHKPAGVSFEQAASLPIAASTALQALRDRGSVQAGQKVLINGASGGVGTFAVQLAKSFGAQVTGVCSTKNLDMVRSLGADRVIDYTKDDFAAGSERYDLILDNVGNRSLSEFRRVLTSGGTYVLIGGGGRNDSRWIGPFGRVISASLLSKFVSQHMAFFIADLDRKDLDALAALVQNGKVTPVIDRRYKLAEVPDAIRYLEEGHARGKIIVDIE